MTDLVLLDLLRVELPAVVAGRDSPVAPVGDGGSDVVGGQGRVLANAVGDNLRKELFYHHATFGTFCHVYD